METLTINNTICNFVPCVEYGYLYNWYAVTDARNIANTGWHVSTAREMDDLNKYLSPDADANFGDDNTSSDPLREIGTEHWESPNTGATNTTKFNGRGSGLREHIYGDFGDFTLRCRIWSSTEKDSSRAHRMDMISGNSFLYASWWNETWDLFQVNYINDKKQGASIRLIKDSTLLSNGEEGTYTGNDGKVYRTICIGTQEWLADNLQETKYRNGDLILTVEDATTWSNLTTGAKCAYDNDYSYVGCGVTG